MMVELHHDQVSLSSVDGDILVVSNQTARQTDIVITNESFYHTVVGHLPHHNGKKSYFEFSAAMDESDVQGIELQKTLLNFICDALKYGTPTQEPNYLVDVVLLFHHEFWVGRVRDDGYKETNYFKAIISYSEADERYNFKTPYPI